MEVKAAARIVRIAPRRVRLALDLIRDKNAAEAVTILKLTNKASSPVVEKVLMSALANTEHNYNMNAGESVVKETYANGGPTLKRLRPHVQGRAGATSKHTSHTTIVVSNGKEEAREA